VLRFSDLFERTTSRSEVVATFLALLELIRMRLLTAVQNSLFGEIEIRRNEPAVAAAAPSAGDSPPDERGLPEAAATAATAPESTPRN
jgi:hypothetical protein